MNIDPDLFTSPDLSEIIHNNILNGTIHEDEFPDAWRGKLEQYVQFPFCAEYKVRKKVLNIEVLHFQYFKYDWEKWNVKLEQLLA